MRALLPHQFKLYQKKIINQQIKNDRQAVVNFMVGTQGLYIPMFVYTPWAPFTSLRFVPNPFLGSRPRPMHKINDRQAVVNFMVGTQGLEPWTQ